MSIFGMITTAASRSYTDGALSTFWETTPTEAIEAFYLIDNDGDYEMEPRWADRLELLRNTHPLSFAANCNEFIKRAEQRDTDVFLLNNDLHFTDGWCAPCLQQTNAIVSPVSNSEQPSRYGELDLRAELDLADLAGHEHELSQIVNERRRSYTGYQKVLNCQFFCVHIPINVYRQVGLLDPSFGRGGGEDTDYCLRAILGGFNVLYAKGAFVVHYRGKSTWRGPETREQIEHRNQLYFQRFRDKWGDALTRWAILGDTEVIHQLSDGSELFKSGNFRELIIQLRSIG